MKKLLILALASAFVAAANAADVSWFSANANGSTTADWSSTPQVKDGVISVDEDVGTALALTPKVGNTAPAPQVKTVVTVVAQFDTINDVNELAEPGEDAKTAFTVANVSGTPRYRYWNGSGWAELDDAVTAVTNSAITIKIELDNSTPNTTKAAFKVNDSLIGQTKTIASNAEIALSGLAFAGTGSLTSVAATVTPAYAEYAGTRYETTAAAVAARTTAGGNDNITMYDPVEVGKYDLYDNANNKVYYTSTSGNTTTLAGVFPDSGDGTENNPWKIRSLAELKAFQVYVATNYPTAGKYFQQTANITLDAAWPGIGLQNGKDSYASEAFNAAAFCGTFDGDNHTISGFQMVGVAGNPASTTQGLDYCGFFNSTYNATIKNLKIQYAGALFAADTTASTKESGATFVGVAKNSTLQNLTSLQKDEDTAVSCSKGFGGIVGYTTSGTVVDSCTNNVNMTSLAGNKCGGIAMITQNGNAVTIRNCQNNGTQTTNSSNSEYGAIVGYVGLDTTISNCETTVGRFLKHHGNTVTLQGVNKGDARVASYHGAATPGLNFATVSGNVATFVADDALAAGNTYKVMATGATATATLATKGSEILFDTSLATPTFNITAGAGLVAKSSTSENVTTYTADEGYEVVSTAETTLVAVPANCNAAGLISTDNRDTGDILKVYSKGDKCYYTWTLTGAKGTWTPLQTWVINGEASATSHEEAASAVQLYAGQAAWLTRTSAASKNAKIILAVVAEAGTMKVDVSKEYNLVAPPPSDTAYDAKVNLKVAEGGSFDEGDQIVVPTTTAPLAYTRKGDTWKVLSGESTTPTGLPEGWGAVANPAWTEASKIEIPSGQGFWFYSKTEKKLEF